MKFFHSIRWRLQLWHALLLLFVLAGFGFTAWRLQQANQLRHVDQDLAHRVSVLASVMRLQNAAPGRPPGPHGPPPGRPPFDSIEAPPAGRPGPTNRFPDPAGRSARNLCRPPRPSCVCRAGRQVSSRAEPIVRFTTSCGAAMGGSFRVPPPRQRNRFTRSQPARPSPPVSTEPFVSASTTPRVGSASSWGATSAANWRTCATSRGG